MLIRLKMNKFNICESKDSLKILILFKKFVLMLKNSILQ